MKTGSAIKIIELKMMFSQKNAQIQLLSPKFDSNGDFSEAFLISKYYQLQGGDTLDMADSPDQNPTHIRPYKLSTSYLQYI